MPDPPFAAGVLTLLPYVHTRAVSTCPTSQLSFRFKLALIEAQNLHGLPAQHAK